MLYLSGTYGIGRELSFGPGVTVMAEPDARFRSVNGNPSGITFTRGGYAYKQVLPHLEGFSGFCARLLGGDLAAMQFQTLTRCGDGIRLELRIGNDEQACLDNTIWFDKIVDSTVGE